MYMCSAFSIFFLEYFLPSIVNIEPRFKKILRMEEQEMSSKRRYLKEEERSRGEGESGGECMHVHPELSMLARAVVLSIGLDIFSMSFVYCSIHLHLSFLAGEAARAKENAKQRRSA